MLLCKSSSRNIRIHGFVTCLSKKKKTKFCPQVTRYIHHSWKLHLQRLHPKLPKRLLSDWFPENNTACSCTQTLRTTLTVIINRLSKADYSWALILNLHSDWEIPSIVNKTIFSTCIQFTEGTNKMFYLSLSPIISIIKQSLYKFVQCLYNSASTYSVYCPLLYLEASVS